MSYKHIIFDLDGTLINPEEGIRESLLYSTEKMNIPFDVDSQMPGFIGPPLHVGFMKVLGLNEGDADKAVKYFREQYGISGLYRSKLFDGVRGMLQDLKGKGCSVYIATSKYELYAKKILKHLNIERDFNFVSGAAYKGNAAGKKELIARVLNEIPNNQNELTVMVGDTHFDIEGANETGIDSIGVLYGYGTQESLIGAGANHLEPDVLSLHEWLIKGKA